LFIFNKFLIKEYKKYINSNYHILGNFKNNIIQVKKTKYHNNFILISEIHFKKNGEMILSFEKKLMTYIQMFLSKANKKINILLKNRDSLNQKKEINFYKKIFKTNCVFYKSLSWEQSYKTIDKFENIIFMYSTLGYESIARKKKVAVFSPDQVEGFKYHFGWPATYKKSYEFFSSKKITYNCSCNHSLSN
jgi:surface carbohydrate biosynthesis protein